MDELKEMVKAYREALEGDYCESGNYSGLRPDEIALRICDKIEALTK